MRIEINRGGLVGPPLSGYHDDIRIMLANSDDMVSTFDSLKNHIYSINGGVGSLQGALDQLELRKETEDTKRSALQAVYKANQDFLSLVYRVDGEVAEMVDANKKAFYQVNPWAVPTPSFAQTGVEAAKSIKEWLAGVMGDASNLAPWAVVGGPLGIAAAAGAMYFGKDGSTTVTTEGHGPTGDGDWSDGKISGSLLSGKVTSNATIFGIDSTSTASGELIGGSVTAKGKASWDLEKGNAGITGEVGAEGHLAKGEISGQYGLLGTKTSGTVGSVGATGSIGATLMKDGKFSPSIGAKAEASASVAKGDTSVTFGDDEYNVHAGAKGSVLTAKANAEAQAGVITYKNDDGVTKTEVGASASAGAEAYLAEGSVSGGFNLFGVKIDVGLSGKAGGVGAKAGGRVTTGGASGEVGLGLGVGAGVKVDVDWTGFQNPFEDFSLDDLKFWEKW